MRFDISLVHLVDPVECATVVLRLMNLTLKELRLGEDVCRVLVPPSFNALVGS